MHQSFSYVLLITSVFAILSCKTNFISTNYSGQNIEVTENVNSLDSQLVRQYMPFKKQLEKDMQRVIAISEAEMVKNKPESGLTNFLADLLLDEGNAEFQKIYSEEVLLISYFNYGGIRTFLPEGEITVGKIFELMPFENEMVFLKLNGSQIKQFLDGVAEKGGDSVGGCRFVISEGKAKKVQIGGNPLVDDSFYWMVTNDYVANGGDGLDVFTRRTEIVQSGIKIRDVIISHLEKHHQKGTKIVPKLDGRITHE